MAELRAAGHNFIAPEEGETNLQWSMKMRETIQEQRQGKVTEELVRRINEFLDYETSLEELRQKFSHGAKLL